MRDKALLSEIINNNFKKPYNDLFKQLIEPSISIRTIPNDLIKMGNSKFGGNPHVKEHFEWPLNHENYPLSFLCQINLEEISIGLLPKSGFLYFFFDWTLIDFGKVIYMPGSEVDFILPMPVKETEYSIKNLLKSFFKRKKKIPRVQECGCELYIDYHVPSQDSIYFDLLNSRHKIENIPNVIYEEDVYEKDLLKIEYGNEEYCPHRLLGHYKPIQSGYFETRFVSSEITDKEEIITEASKWKLLLQIGTDENIKFTWGDSGQIYFFIHEKDIEASDFSKVRVTGDCY